MQTFKGLMKKGLALGKGHLLCPVVEISAGYRTRPTGNPFCLMLQSRKRPIIFTSFGSFWLERMNMQLTTI